VIRGLDRSCTIHDEIQSAQGCSEYEVNEVHTGNRRKEVRSSNYWDLDWR
jgi:hypothetical protein